VLAEKLGRDGFRCCAAPTMVAFYELARTHPPDGRGGPRLAAKIRSLSCTCSAKQGLTWLVKAGRENFRERSNALALLEVQRLVSAEDPALVSGWGFLVGTPGSHGAGCGEGEVLGAQAKSTKHHRPGSATKQVLSSPVPGDEGLAKEIPSSSRNLRPLEEDELRRS